MLSLTYVIYLVLCLAITLGVGMSLHKNGRIFLIENYKGDTKLADSVSHLLLVGFYLINLGFVLIALKSYETPETSGQIIEVLSDKVGWIVLAQGIIHFCVMRALIKLKDFKALRDVANALEETVTPTPVEAALAKNKT